MQEVSGMLNIVHMTVNGKEVELAVDPRESLLETLRNRLGLTSVKGLRSRGVRRLHSAGGRRGHRQLHLPDHVGGRPQHHDSGRVKGAKRRAEHYPEGIYRGGGSSVRFLYAGTDHDSGGDRRYRKAV